MCSVGRALHNGRTDGRRIHRCPREIWQEGETVEEVSADQGIDKRASFDIIRYSNCWEDADVLLSAIDAKEDGVYLSIASSGDSPLSLLSKSPSLVLAVDISLPQIACTEIRKVIFGSLSYEEVLCFLGIDGGIDRVSLYRKMRRLLSMESREFWDRHEKLIDVGIVHVGKFESYFRLFRTRILPFLLSKRAREELLEEKGEAERLAFYEGRLNTWRWKMLFRIFFSRALMGNLGRDPEFFKYVVGDVAQEIMERAKYALTSLPTHNNPYLEWIVTGNFRRAFPFYLREENFERISQNLDKLVVFKGSLSDALQAHRGLKFDGLNLSDVFEYISYDEYVSELERVIRWAKEGARLVYWNMMVARSRPISLQERLSPLSEIARDLFTQNKAFFYRSLVIEEVR